MPNTFTSYITCFPARIALFRFLLTDLLTVCQRYAYPAHLRRAYLLLSSSLGLGDRRLTMKSPQPERTALFKC